MDPFKAAADLLDGAVLHAKFEARFAVETLFQGFPKQVGHGGLQLGQLSLIAGSCVARRHCPRPYRNRRLSSSKLFGHLAAFAQGA
jgi:hypothetical protein